MVVVGTHRISRQYVSTVNIDLCPVDIFVLVTSRLGPVALAAQSVLLVSASTSFQGPFALSVATSVRYVSDYHWITGKLLWFSLKE